MFAFIATLLKFGAGLVDLIQSFVKQADDEKLREQGRLQELGKQQKQKEQDEDVAAKVDARPTPTDKHIILDGM